jgi:hypothetical protein
MRESVVHQVTAQSASRSEADQGELRANGYFRDPRRVAPHNLYARPAALLAQARGAGKASDIGFRFGPLPAGGRAASSFSVSYPGAAQAVTIQLVRGAQLALSETYRKHTRTC